MQKGRRMNTVRDVSQIVQQIEKWELRDEREKKESDYKPKNRNNVERNFEKKGKDKNKDKGQKTDIRNPCKFPGHGAHDWKDCKYNSKSDNFCGETRSLRDSNTDGSSKNKKGSGGKKTETFVKNFPLSVKLFLGRMVAQSYQTC